MEKDTNQIIKTVGQSRRFGMAELPDISVLIPTYNRSKALQRTLTELENQSIDLGLFEIIVVDDGSKDNTEYIMQQFANETACRMSYAILRENGGPARARNAGLGMCRGNVVLIIGDDIEPERTLLEKHLEFHKNNYNETFALLGHVSFPEELNPNAFMRWLEKDGRKYYFNYADLDPKQLAEPIFFYTCNVSVKLSLLEKSGWFDESFSYASHEDLELGWRLAEKGMQLVYQPEAKGYHWHMLSVQGIARRVYLMGHSAALFWLKIDDKSSRIRIFARRLFARICTTYVAVVLWDRLRRKEYRDEKDYPFHWQALLFLSFFIGLSDSMSGKGVRL